MCTGLQDLGYEVVIVGPPGIEVNPNVPVNLAAGKADHRWAWISRHLPQFSFELMEIAYNVVAVPRLVKKCRSVRPRFIYERYALYNAAGVIASRLMGIPIVIEINDTVNVDRTRQGKSLRMPWLAGLFERFIFSRAAGLVTVSGYLREQAIKAGAKPENVTVTPNAVEPDRFDPERFDGSEVRGRHGLHGATVIGWLGSFTKWHRVDLLVSAAAKLSAEFPDIKLLLVGDGAMRSEVQAHVRELGMEDRVVFAGVQAHAEVPNHIAAMDIGVVSGANEFVSPVKVFEYMGMGKASVSASYGPLREVIEHGVNGLLFEPLNEESLTECLRALLADPERRQRIGRTARDRVLSAHLWVHNAERAVALIQPGAGTPVSVGRTVGHSA